MKFSLKAPLVSVEMKMSGLNGDPELIADDDGIIEDEDDFNEEGEFYVETQKPQKRLTDSENKSQTFYVYYI